MKELFIVEFEDGSMVDSSGDGGFSVFSSQAEAQDALDSEKSSMDERDGDLSVVRYFREGQPMAEAKHVPGVQVLIGYFGEMIAHHCSVAGCNDMPQETFEPLSEDEKAALLADFLAWDKQANPDGWEPTTFAMVQDSSWGGYLMDRFLA